LQTKRGEQLHGIEEEGEEGEQKAAGPEGGEKSRAETRQEGLEEIREEGRQAAGPQGGEEEGPGAQEKGLSGARAGNAAHDAGRHAIAAPPSAKTRRAPAAGPFLPRGNKGRGCPLPPLCRPGMG
jgi:hypothetical protein